MYEFCDEAIRALTPKSAHPVTAATPPESWVFKHLAASRAASVTHLKFKSAQTFGDVTASGLREDFAQLADRLPRDSKVVLDFTGVVSFDSASIDALIQLDKHLRNKGSRIALCSLSPAARECFFVNPSQSSRAM
jgi:anti-anti-sigma regulatory factor